jgi:hypothetical protein
MQLEPLEDHPGALAVEGRELTRVILAREQGPLEGAAAAGDAVAGLDGELMERVAVAGQEVGREGAPRTDLAPRDEAAAVEVEAGEPLELERHPGQVRGPPGPAREEDAAAVQRGALGDGGDLRRDPGWIAVPAPPAPLGAAQGPGALERQQRVPARLGGPGPPREHRRWIALVPVEQHQQRQWFPGFPRGELEQAPLAGHIAQRLRRRHGPRGAEGQQREQQREKPAHQRADRSSSRSTK